MPYISVIITTYNRAKELKNAIKSVLSQTFKDYELIVIDDGSVDNTKNIIKEFGNKINYYYQRNQGVSAARNIGIILSRGEWISFLDSDDLWLPEKLEFQINATNQFARSSGMCFTDCLLSLNGTLGLSAFQQAGFSPERTFGELENPMELILHKFPAIYIPSTLIKKKILDGFDLDLRVGEDTDLFFRLSLITKFCFVNRPLVIIDRSLKSKPSRLSSLIEKHDRSALLSKEIMFKKWMSILHEKKMNYEYELIRNRLINHYFGWLILSLKRLDFQTSINLVRKLQFFGLSSWDISTILKSRFLNRMARILSKNTNV